MESPRVFCGWGYYSVFPFIFQGGAAPPKIFVNKNRRKFVLKNYKMEDSGSLPGFGFKGGPSAKSKMKKNIENN